MSETLRVLEHPLAAAALSTMRDKRTSNAEFRRALSELTTFLVYEATRELETEVHLINTPVSSARSITVAKPITLVPILRAGLGMLESAERLLPSCNVGFMGMARDEETHLPRLYLESLPESMSGITTIVLDPMLATGGSLIACLEALRKRNADDVTVVCALAAPEGVHRVCDLFGDIRLFTASVDERLNDDAFIVPGLGDAGDRQFGEV